MQRLSTILMLAILLLPAGAAIACPMCKDSLPQPDPANETALPGGFNASIYYMLGALFVTIALVGSVIAMGIRSTQARTDGRSRDVISQPADQTKMPRD